MNELIKNILLKTVIVLMAVLLGMPCSVKREIKQFLDVPLSETTTPYSSSHICTNNATERSTKKTTVSKKAKHPNSLFQTLFHKEVIVALEHQSTPRSGKSAKVHVPLYILHGEYLI